MTDSYMAISNKSPFTKTIWKLYGWNLVLLYNSKRVLHIKIVVIRRTL
jgi:hypothetical protein